MSTRTPIKQEMINDIDQLEAEFNRTDEMDADDGSFAPPPARTPKTSKTTVGAPSPRVTVDSERTVKRVTLAPLAGRPSPLVEASIARPHERGVLSLDDYDEPRHVNIPLDVARNVARLSWGLELPLKPFFGVMGVAPPPGWGRVTSVAPQAFAGNLDNKELGAGATLFLPVFVEGALFSCGDGHGAQGDGEVCITAIETALKGKFEFIVRKDLTFRYPRAETPTHYITMGMDPDLDQCAVIALRDMIALVGEKAGLSHADAYMLCSIAGDLHITQTVNGSKGVHMMLEKTLLA